MSHEFQYTSAERTLQPGLKGFGPVVVSRGIPATLQEKLVVLSAYRHLFSGQDAKAKLNPVNYAHLIVPASGKTFHVLSRVSDAGFDYSRRSNKFAHHVAVDVDERPIAGPAAVLAAAGFMATGFSGEPIWLDQGRRLPKLEGKAAICRAWQAVTGDAGWGGVLAQTALQDSTAPVIVVYRLGTDVLPLIAESLALLPPERRWQVTFSTFYTKLPPGVNCLWRCMPAEDPETATALKALNVRVIDLTKKLDKPVPSPWVEAARTGHPPVAKAASPKDRPLTLVAEQGTKALAGKGATVDVNSLQLGPLGSVDLIDFDNLPSIPMAQAIDPAEYRDSSRRWWLVGGMAAGLAILVSAGVLVANAARSRPTTVAATTPTLPAKATAQPSPEPPKATVKPAVEAPDEQGITKVDAAPLKTSSKTPPAEDTATVPTQPTQPVAVTPVVESPPVDSFAMLRRSKAESLGLPLSLPPTDRLANTSGDEAEWTTLVELPKVNLTKLELTLEVPPGVAAKFELEPLPASGRERSWSVVRLTGSPAGDDQLGTLRVAQEQLQFRWSRVTPGMQPQLLGRARLSVQIGEMRESIRMQIPQPLADQFANWESNSLDFPKSIPWSAQQRTLVTLNTPPGGSATANSQVAIAPGERRVLSVPIRNDGAASIEVAVRATSRAPCTLTIDYTLLTTVTVADGSSVVERHLLKPEVLLAAETLARRKIEELLQADKTDKELIVWRQRLTQYEQLKNWRTSSAASNLRLRCRMFRREDLDL
jgi:hypothetical protein